jgi:protein gp37
MALQALDWVIVGGESGVGARPMELDWARALRDQAIQAGKAFFFKQIGGPPGRKRDQMADFPEDLKIRDFPVARHASTPSNTMAR